MCRILCNKQNSSIYPNNLNNQILRFFKDGIKTVNLIIDFRIILNNSSYLCNFVQILIDFSKF